MLNLQFVSQFMYENFERVTVSSDGTHFHARCPLCGDSKKSLSKKRFHCDWEPDKVFWQCWNCSESGNFLTLYARLKGISNSDAYKILYKFDHEDYKNSLKKQNGTTHHTETDKPNNNHNYILKDCIDENKKVDSVLWGTWCNALVSFRKDRQIPPNYPVYFAYQGKYKNRIIIPIIKNGNIIYFQARRVPETDIQPKYKNPAGEKSLIIHNEDNFDEDKYIMITEGLLDSFSIGNQGTTCLGKEIIEEFLAVLFQKTKKGIILIYDNDEDGYKSLKKFMFGYKKKKVNKYCRKVKYFLMPKRFLMYKDINSLCCKEKIQNSYEFIIQNSYDYMETAMMMRLEGR